jgi:hypothetical protein
VTSWGPVSFSWRILMHVVSFQIVPGRPWGQRSFLFDGERRSLVGREADSSLHLVIRLRMSGALPQFPDIRLWRARVQLYVHAAMLSGFPLSLRSRYKLVSLSKYLLSHFLASRYLKEAAHSDTHTHTHIAWFCDVTAVRMNGMQSVCVW